MVLAKQGVSYTCSTTPRRNIGDSTPRNIGDSTLRIIEDNTRRNIGDSTLRNIGDSVIHPITNNNDIIKLGFLYPLNIILQWISK